MIGWWAGGLNEEEIVAADILFDFHKSFAVREGRDLGIAEFGVEVTRDFFCECRMGGAGNELEHHYKVLIVG